MNELSWIALISASATLLTFAIIYRVNLARRRATERWRRMEEDPDAYAKEMLFGPATPWVASMLPVSRRGEVELRRALRTAGYYRANALHDYAALRAILVVLPLLTTALLALLLPVPWVQPLMMGGSIAAILGYSVPRFYLMIRGRQRSHDIEFGLPFAVDLLSLSLSAGQNALGSLKQVSHELRNSHPALAEELHIVEEQASLSSMSHALQQFSERVPIPDVRNLSLLLIQSERLGSDVSAALLEFSTNQRMNMRQHAETRANRTSFWMIFPSVLCFWVAAAIVLVGPLYYDFWFKWGAAGQMSKQAQQDARRMTNNPPQAGPTANQPTPP